MGVRGMQTYLETSGSPLCSTVDMKDVIEKARREGKSTVIVANGMSCLHFMYRDLPWIPGGQLKEYLENVKDFVLRFTSLGAELVFCFPRGSYKLNLERWKRKRLVTIDIVEDLFDKLNAGIPSTSLEEQRAGWMVIPKNLGAATRWFLKQAGCKVVSENGKHAKEAARYAFQNNCLAILGQDTDFVIYPGTFHYWSVKHFNKHNMTTLEYNGKKLADSLRIDYTQLPLLATLLGNSIVTRDDLEVFHQSLASQRYVSFPRLILNVTRFIRRYPSGDALYECLPAIALKVFNDPSKSQLLKDSIEFYDILQPAKDDLDCETGNETWDAVRCMVNDRGHRKLGDVVLNGIYKRSGFLEDYREHDFPANQVILKKLRQKMYGIMLFDKPKNGDDEHIVRELAVSGRESLDNIVNVPAISPRVTHPGLLELWNSNDHSVEDVRWALLCDAVRINQDIIRNDKIPLHLAIFVLSLKYLMDEGMKLFQYELYSLISSAVILQDYTPEMLSRLPSDKLDTRAIRLYTLMTCAYGSVKQLNIACGNPIPANLALPMNYQDGKLFHQTYSKAITGTSVEQLCENKVANVQVFNAILDVLPKETVVSARFFFTATPT